MRQSTSQNLAGVWQLHFRFSVQVPVVVLGGGGPTLLGRSYCTVPPYASLNLMRNSEKRVRRPIVVVSITTIS